VKHDPFVRFAQVLIVGGLGAFLGWGGSGTVDGALTGASVCLVGLPILDWWCGGIFS